MKWLGYFWRVAVNGFYLFIVFYVLDKLDRRPEIITVAVLGLIYVTIRTIAIGQTVFHLHNYTQIAKSVLYLRSLVNDPTYEENKLDWEQAEARVPTVVAKLYIDGFFLSVISLLCLVVLFSHL